MAVCRSFLAFVSTCVLSLFTFSQSEPQLMNLVKFDDSNSDPNAVCNDGTRGGYYFSKAIDPSQSNSFVVHLPGGGQCYDKESCDNRADNMMSFNYAPSTISVTGYLDASPSNTPLWGANKAYLVYCSSDGYMGDAPASNETWGYHFRGQRLVHSLFQALTLNHGFNESTMVYLTGSSAGARGMMTHMDQLVRDWIPPSAQVVGLLDSPYYLDVVPYSSDSKGFQYQEQQKYKYYNTQAVLSAECMAAYPLPEEQWKCQFGEHRMPFVKTPYFLVFDQFDSYQLDELTRSSPDVYTPEITAYATEFGLYGRTSMQNLSSSTGTGSLPRPSAHPHGNSVGMEHRSHSFVRTGFFAPPKTAALSVSSAETADAAAKPPLRANTAAVSVGYGYYSTACYYHAIGSSALFYTTASNDKTIMRDAFSTYLSHLSAARTHSTARGEVFKQEYDGLRAEHTTLDQGQGREGGRGFEAEHKHKQERDHHAGSTEAWSLTWIDSCTGFACGLYCNGIV